MTLICLVDDNEKIGVLTKHSLENEGRRCDYYMSAEEVGVDMVYAYDVFIIDVMLPGKDGFEFVHMLRQHTDAGIIFVTARGTQQDKKIGFDVGCDDFITKPFDINELILRIKAILKRIDNSSFSIDDVTIDCEARLVTKGQNNIHLTTTEWNVLIFLIQQGGKVCQRIDIIEYVRGEEEIYSMSRTLDVIIAGLRKKIGKDAIRTITGVGYALEKS